ncbi:MAG: ABC transporter permease [Paraglaciecola chathamensis]
MSVTPHKPRTSWQVTRSVWYALFMREALSRTMSDRFAWFWMFAEPMLMVSIMVGIRAFGAGGLHLTAGADFVGWSITGLLGFFLFREALTRSLGAIDSNQALFTYRQVHPVDTIIVRCVLEGLLKTIILILFVILGSLLGFDIIPDSPLSVLFNWLGLWLLGTGFGLSFSALTCVVPDIGRIVRLSTLPLLIVSGTLMPLNFLPHNILEYLMWNPILHGIELIREGFYKTYNAVDGVSLLYFWLLSLSSIAVGLLLNISLSQRLKSI